MTLAKYLYLLKKHQKACNLKFPPFHKNELKKNTKTTETKQNKNIWNHLFLSVENNNRYIRFQDK